MTRCPHPTCDRHPNLQMVSCWLKRPKGVVAGYVCPVPGCDRYHVDDHYLNAADVELVLSTNTRGKDTLKKSLQKHASKRPASNQDRPLNRHAAARAAILKAIEQKQQT
jgi:hypothetical protein